MRKGRQLRIEATGSITVHVAIPGEHLARLLLAEQVLASRTNENGFKSMSNGSDLKSKLRT